MSHFVWDKCDIVKDALLIKCGVVGLKLKDFWLTMPMPPLYYNEKMTVEEMMYKERTYTSDARELEEFEQSIRHDKKIIDDGYGRWMNEEERKRFEEEVGRPPFSDEEWIILRHTGINVRLSSGVLSKDNYRKFWGIPTNYMI